jgi:carboxylesterase
VWNISLIGYKEKHTSPIYPILDNVFDPRCLPITLEHDEKSDKAIIMIHGLPSTPYAYDYASHAAHKQGYDVFVPLLPGFGTKPEDLAETSFSQWYQYMKEFYLQKRSQYKNLYIIGTSMGGAMTLRLSEEFSGTQQEPNAVCSIAAPVFLNNIREGVVKSYLYYIARTVAIFVSTIKTEIHAGGREKNDGDELWIGYNGTFVRVGVSFLYALKLIRRDLSKITLPIIVIHDKEDHTVSYKNLSYIIRHISSTHAKEITTKMDAPHNHHVLLMHTSIQESLLKTILTFFEQHTYKEPL